MSSIDQSRHSHGIVRGLRRIRSPRDSTWTIPTRLFVESKSPVTFYIFCAKMLKGKGLKGLYQGQLIFLLPRLAGSWGKMVVLKRCRNTLPHHLWLQWRAAWKSSDPEIWSSDFWKLTLSHQPRQRTEVAGNQAPCCDRLRPGLVESCTGPVTEPICNDFGGRSWSLKGSDKIRRDL